MSERNGDRARFQKERMRKLRQRQRVRLLAIAKPAADTTAGVSRQAPRKRPAPTGD